VTVRLRVPGAAQPDAVFVRYVHDGEARFAPAEIDERIESETWWRASFRAWNPRSRYRWLISGGTHGYAWLNGVGVIGHDVPDADDFVIGFDEGPEWHRSAIVYEIFPDRFASSGSALESPEWALARPWDARPMGRGPRNALEWFGGDLRGIEQHLDHVARLGASTLFLRSVFPASSTHRYDVLSFDEIDPLLGGDAAFSSLLRAAHARGLRVIGDLTTNHTGDRHPCFDAARGDGSAPERDFYHFDPSLPSGYETWFDVPSLPKLNWSSAELRRRMAGIARRWLDAGLDGWRIDVANMTGRRHDQDLHDQVARTLRAAVAQARADAALIAEHCHDFRGDLTGDGWHGVMNYAGFLRPVWQWLRSQGLAVEVGHGSHGIPVGLPELGGEELVATIRAFRAGVPWATLEHSWSLLDSCDSARFRTVAGDREHHLVGVALQMTLPGVPMVCAGDEVGLEGAWGEDGRRTMPWNRDNDWDSLLEQGYRKLIALRRSSPALEAGGLRFVHADADAVAYLRELPGERILLVASRGAHRPLRIPLRSLGASGLDAVYGCEAEVVDGTTILPAEGPSFGAWRLRDGHVPSDSM
jgi:alpha-glucosidase